MPFPIIKRPRPIWREEVGDMEYKSPWSRPIRVRNDGPDSLRGRNPIDPITIRPPKIEYGPYGFYNDDPIGPDSFKARLPMGTDANADKVRDKKFQQKFGKSTHVAKHQGILAVEKEIVKKKPGVRSCSIKEHANTRTVQGYTPREMQDPSTCGIRPPAPILEDEDELDGKKKGVKRNLTVTIMPAKKVEGESVQISKTYSIKNEKQVERSVDPADEKKLGFLSGILKTDMSLVIVLGVCALLFVNR